MDQIQSKAAQLGELLNKVSSHDQLSAQVNSFFDESIARFENHRADLLKEIQSHSITADQKVCLASLVAELDKLISEAPDEAAVSESERLLDAQERLDACLSREQELLQSGQFDALSANRHLARLLKSLAIDWSDPLTRKRQADNPFSCSVAADAFESAESDDGEETGDLNCVGYRVVEKVDFSPFLSANKSNANARELQPADTADDAKHNATYSRGASFAEFPRRRGYNILPGNRGSRARSRPNETRPLAKVSGNKSTESSQSDLDESLKVKLPGKYHDKAGIVDEFSSPGYTTASAASRSRGRFPRVAAAGNADSRGRASTRVRYQRTRPGGRSGSTRGRFYFSSATFTNSSRADREQTESTNPFDDFSD